MASSAQELVAELVGRGYSRRYIGNTIGRNDSLIGQVLRGAKPGTNLVSSLERLVEHLPATPPKNLPTPEAIGVPAPKRRVTKAGGEAATRTARVRQKDTRGGTGWGVSPVKRQATRNGARRLAGVLENARVTGRRVGWSVTVDPKVRVSGSGGKAAVQHKRKGSTPASQEIRLGDNGNGFDPETWLDLVDEHDGNVTEAMAAHLVATGMAESIDATQIWGMELRTWT